MLMGPQFSQQDGDLQNAVFKLQHEVTTSATFKVLTYFIKEV